MLDPQRPVWLITGAAGALGRELTRQAMDSGADCIALDRNQPGLNALHDERVKAGRPAPALMPMDLAGATPADYQKLAETVEATFGRLDVLVHNAMSFKALRPILHQSPEEWIDIVQTGLTGPFLLSAALMPLLGRGGNGTIVFINDGLPIDKPANWAAYGVAEAGRRQMVETLRAESGNRGPRILAFDPGAFYSPLRTAAWPSDSPEKLPAAGDAAKRVIEQIVEARRE